MKKILIAGLVWFASVSISFGADWATQGYTEDTEADGTEKIFVENSAGTANNWMLLSRLKTWFDAAYQPLDANLPTWPATVDATEVGYLNGLSEAISTSLSGKVSTTGNENIAGVKTFTDGIATGTSADGPGVFTIAEDSDNGSNYVGVGSPASNANDLIILLPTSDPTAGQIPTFAVPASVTFADGVARDATQWSWTNLPTAASLSVDDLISLSGLAEGTTTISDPNTDITATTVDGALTELAAAVELNTAKTGVSAAAVGGVSGDLDDTDASIEWENAADLESDGSISANAVTYAETAGSYKAPTPTISDPDTWTMSGAGVYGGIWIANAAGTAALPAATAGMNFTILLEGANAVILDPDGTGTADTIYMNGTAAAADENITSSTSGAICVFTYRAADTWMATCNDFAEATP